MIERTMMYYSNKFNNVSLFLFFFLLVLLCGNVNANKKILREVRNCFVDENNEEENRSNADILSCLSDISQCFNTETTVDDIKSCVTENLNNNNNGTTTTTDGDGRQMLDWVCRMLANNNNNNKGNNGNNNNNNRRPGNFEGFENNPPPPCVQRRREVLRTCLEPYRECVRDEVRTFVKESLPDCFNETAFALGTCYKTNAVSCNATCTTADIPTSNPFIADADDLANNNNNPAAQQQVVRCNGFQNRIMVPSCNIIDCCEECIVEFEQLMTCIAQDVAQVQPQPCTLECPNAPPNDRRQRQRQRQILQQQLDDDDRHHRDLRRQQGGGRGDDEPPQAYEISDECAVYLDTKEEGTDITTTDNNAITSKLLEGEFIACVQDTALSVSADQVAYDDQYYDSTNDENNDNDNDLDSNDNNNDKSDGTTTTATATTTLLVGKAILVIMVFYFLG